MASSHASTSYEPIFDDYPISLSPHAQIETKVLVRNLVAQTRFSFGVIMDQEKT
jgi:hypothetical protein